MARRRDRLNAAPAQQERQREAREAQRRLGVLGQPQLVVVRSREQAWQGDAGRGRTFLTELADLGVLEELDYHAGPLRALDGEQGRHPRRYSLALMHLRPAPGT